MRDELITILDRYSMPGEELTETVKRLIDERNGLADRVRVISNLYAESVEEVLALEKRYSDTLARIANAVEYLAKQAKANEPSESIGPW